MTNDRRPSFVGALRAASFALLALCLPACDDPTCVFGGNCFGSEDNEGALGSTAVAPVDGELLLAAAPTLLEIQPDGGAARNPATPVALVFSESMSSAATLEAFEIVDTQTNFAAAATTVLAADGRVLVLFPTPPLAQGSYAVRLAAGAGPLDLTGQALGVAQDADLATFTIAGAMNLPAEPSVVLLFPLDGSTNNGPTAEIVCVFDREVRPPLDLATGWDVKVQEVGSMVAVDPAFDPDPMPLTVAGFLGVPIPDPRMWTWRSVDGDEPQRLGRSGAEVTVTVSDPMAPFVDDANPSQTVAETASTFTLSLAPQPFAGLLNPGFEPQDAIGIANVDGLAGMQSLALQVDFEPDDLAQAGDVLTVFFVGTDPTDALNTIAFSRSIVLSGAGGIASAEISLADLDFLRSTEPLGARVADGAVRFAVRLERGGDQGHVRILDVDLLDAGVQDPVVDLVRPELLLLDGQVALTDEFRSDVLDLTVAGHADVGPGDFVRAALVTTSMSDNATMVGVVPPVVGSALSVVDAGSGPTPSSMFLAAPVPVGRLPAASGTLTFTLTVFDRALNSVELPVTLAFRQRGAVGSTPLDPTDPAPLTVEVFDAQTLEPIEGALVYSHAEVDDGMGNLSYPLLGGGASVSNAGGFASVPHHDATQAATLVTVVVGGFDVFTFHGVPTTSLSIPLTPAQVTLGTETNSVLVAPDVNISTLVRRVGDTRRIETAFPTRNTLNTPGTTEFDFDSTLLRPFRLGAQSFLAGIRDADIANVGKDRLVKAFELRVPVDGQELPLSVSEGAFQVTRTLDDPGGPPADVAKSVADVQLTAETIVGIDPENLELDFHYLDQPLVEVEATLPGIDRPVPVGLGTAYDVTGNPRRWNLRSAYAGMADPPNPQAPFEGVLRLRAELREDDPSSTEAAVIVGLRPNVDDLAGLAPLRPPDAPVVTSIPTDGSGSLASQGFDLAFTDVVTDGSGLLLDGRGLHRVTLTEDLAGMPGRRWELFKLDVGGAAEVSVHFPDLSPDPSPIQSGATATTGVRISTFAWESFPAFDPLDALPDVFLWSDLGREVEAFTHSREFTFTLL